MLTNLVSYCLFLTIMVIIIIILAPVDDVLIWNTMYIAVIADELDVMLSCDCRNEKKGQALYNLS